MVRLTINNVSKALKNAGFDAELVKGDGYFWFDGDEASTWYTSSVFVSKLSDISTVQRWVEEYMSMKKAHDNKH